MKKIVLAVLLIASLNVQALDMSYRDKAIYFDKNLLAGMESTNKQLLSHFDKPTLLVFWATWCYVCTAEMPALIAAAKVNKDVNYVFINQYQSMAEVSAYMKKMNFDIPNVVINNGSKPELNAYAQALPVMVFLNNKNQIIASHRGKISAGDLAIKTLLSKNN